MMKKEIEELEANLEEQQKELWLDTQKLKEAYLPDTTK
jgi:hypothetical protein